MSAETDQHRQVKHAAPNGQPVTSLAEGETIARGEDGVRTRRDGRHSWFERLTPWRDEASGADQSRSRRLPLTRLDLMPEVARPAEIELFLGQVQAFRIRVHRRNSWVQAEVMQLLETAARAAVAGAKEAPLDLRPAHEALAAARTIYYQDAQTKNRLTYVLGLGVGAFCIGLLFPLMVALLQGLQNVSGLWQVVPQFIMAAGIGGVSEEGLTLVRFASAGAIASVLSRLTTIDLKDETSKLMVLVAGATRPVLAVLFACVVFVILNGNVVNFGATGAPKQEVILVAAFLCGYSERFASDIIARFPIVGSTATPVPHQLPGDGPPTS